MSDASGGAPEMRRLNSASPRGPWENSVQPTLTFSRDLRLDAGDEPIFSQMRRSSNMACNRALSLCALAALLRSWTPSSMSVSIFANNDRRADM